MFVQRQPVSQFPSLSGKLTVLVVGGADGLVSETISWMARRSLSRCRGLLMPISLWISVSDRADMMAPLFTLARHAATYQAGIPNHNWTAPGVGGAELKDSQITTITTLIQVI